MEHVFNTSSTEGQLRNRQMVNSIAMTLVLVSLSMLFASLFLIYAVLRGSNDFWPPIGMKKLSLVLPTFSTFFIVLSSWFFWKVEKLIPLGATKRLQSNFAATFIFGLLFLLSQLNLWRQLSLNGIYVGDGIFPSLIYGFTWIHAGHMLFGILGLAWLVPFVWKFPRYNLDVWTIRTKNVGKFWHFLTVIWLLMYVSLFVF